MLHFSRLVIKDNLMETFFFEKQISLVKEYTLTDGQDVPVNDDHHLHLGPLHPLLPVLRQNKGVLSRVLNRGDLTEEHRSLNGGTEEL